MITNSEKSLEGVITPIVSFVGQAELQESLVEHLITSGVGGIF